MIGFVVFWVNYFVIDVHISPSIFNGYVSWLGGAIHVSSGQPWEAHSSPHRDHTDRGSGRSDGEAVGVLSLSGIKRNAARLGMWVSGIGIAIMTFIFLLEAFAAYVPPLIFASNPGGSFQLWSSTAANGMAGNDGTMFLPVWAQS